MKKIAIVIGHKQSSQGASNKNTGITEWRFNEMLALKILELSRIDNEIAIDVVYRDTYKKLPSKINMLEPDLIISLHCNAFNETASGTETLYYYSSKKSMKIATKINNALCHVLKLPDRGIKPKHSEDRGGYLLRNTKAPCVLIEPFFIDNDKDLARAERLFNSLAAAIYKTAKDCVI